MLLSALTLWQTTFFKIIMGELEPDEGSFKWGVTTSQSYFPSDNSKYFDGVELTLVDCPGNIQLILLRLISEVGSAECFSPVRKRLKWQTFFSGGERVRCMLCKMMLSGANVL